MPTWLIFLMSAGVVIAAGARLARDGDTISKRTGLGQAWVGAILVAGATSLPEIATDVSAVRAGDHSLAVGDLFGSSMANMLILAVADLLTRQVRMLKQAAAGQAMVASLGIALTAVAAIGALSRDSLTILHIGWPALVIAAGYVLGMRLLHINRASPEGQPADKGKSEGHEPGLRRAVAFFVIAAVLILAAAPFLASSGSTLAQEWGISSGFFGVVFLAAATSLPEVSVVVAAVRAGGHALAVGNLLGSNAFNMLTLVVLDVVDGSGPVLGQVEPGVVTGALFAILLMVLVLLDTLNGSERRRWYLEPGPALIIVVYAAGLYLTYQATH